MRIKHFATGENKTNYESYLKNKTAEFKNYISNLKHTKITLDEPNDAYDYSLTGEIDTQKHTITFPETPTFLSRIVMEPRITPCTNYLYLHC